MQIGDNLHGMLEAYFLGKKKKKEEKYFKMSSAENFK